MDKYVVRKVTKYKNYPMLVIQCKTLFIYIVSVKDDFYSASIESTLPFWRNKYTEDEMTAAVNMALMAGQATIDNLGK